MFFRLDLKKTMTKINVGQFIGHKAGFSAKITYASETTLNVKFSVAYRTLIIFNIIRFMRNTFVGR